MNDEEHVHQLSIEDIQNISAMRHPDVSFDQIDLTTDEARFAMNHAISSQAVTAEEASVGNFTRRKLKKLNTWPSWEAGEHKQLNHFENLQMHGKPVARPEDAIVLRPHWQCQIKRDGARRSRNCCDGSPRSAPALKGIASTCSSSKFVEEMPQMLVLILHLLTNCRPRREFAISEWTEQSSLFLLFFGNHLPPGQHRSPNDAQTQPLLMDAQCQMSGSVWKKQ